MKINKVKLYNFSSYEGNNEFDFEITDAGKNIVLIGGKNGAGKTSLFTAIKVALYGPLAYGYVGVNSHYISNIAIPGRWKHTLIYLGGCGIGSTVNATT